MTDNNYLLLFVKNIAGSYSPQVINFKKGRLFLKIICIQNERCVQFIRLEGYWNDLTCDKEISYMCKKEKQLLPKIPEDQSPVDEGCERGWTAFGN